jgi:hypothetical protein
VTIALSARLGLQLIFFGSVGSIGLLCLTIFGLTEIQRTHFWVFLLAVMAAAILFACGA